MANTVDYKLPDFFYFPPFFTIQPVLVTRKKQLGQWRELILKYLINRELDREAIRVIMDDFVKSGHGEWEDPERKTRCRILWRKPDQLASDVYDWAVTNGYINSVCTVYELHSGEDVHGMSFQGVDEELLQRALGILESQGKCAVFKGETSSEDGLKFF